MPLRQNKLAGVAAGTLALLVAVAAYGDHRFATQDLRRRAEAITGGNAERGRRALATYGCGSCHTIPGVGGATALVGPPLKGVGSRAIIAGKLENNPDNLRRWIIDPQSVTPGTAMPRLGVEPQAARDISAYLYTQS
ncbi:MAG TPA: c-type cytochrome [Allosphingosinicella sp.]|jgi:cytochrome c1